RRVLFRSPHFSLTLPWNCFQLPFTWSQFIIYLLGNWVGALSSSVHYAGRETCPSVFPASLSSPVSTAGSPGETIPLQGPSQFPQEAFDFERVGGLDQVQVEPRLLAAPPVLLEAVRRN